MVRDSIFCGVEGICLRGRKIRMSEELYSKKDLRNSYCMKYIIISSKNPEIKINVYSSMPSTIRSSAVKTSAVTPIISIISKSEDSYELFYKIE